MPENSDMNKEQKEKEQQKRPSLGERLLNSCSGKLDEYNDKRLEFTGRNNYVNFEEGLKTANTNIDPKKYDLATDGQDGEKFVPKRGERDLWKNIEDAKQAIAHDKESKTYRAQQIEEQRQRINSIMDGKGSDILENNIRGYHVELLRTPKDDKDLNNVEIMIGGKRASIHEDLSGMTFSMTGSRPEISRDMIKKAAEGMAAYGKTEWSKGYNSGDSVDISMEASYGKTPVTIIVSDEMKGDSVGIIQAGKYMSGEAWDRAYESMKKTGTTAWKGVLKDGTTIECGFTVKVNGREACIEGMTDKDQNGLSISKEKWEEAYKAMMDNKKQTWVTTLEDGTTISCSLNTFVDGEKAKIDRTEQGMWAKDMPVRAFISKETWDNGIDKIISDPAGTNKAMIASENGKGLELRMNMKVNGVAAVPNTPFREGEIRETKAGISVSRDIVEKAVKEMNGNNSTTYKTTAADGREISFKRPGDLHMFINGHEISKESFDDALAEISGINSSDVREEKGMAMRERYEQFSIIGARKIGEMPFNAARDVKGGISNGLRSAGGTAGSLLRMLLQQATRTVGIR